MDKLSGNLIIIGGAEDKEGKKEILKKACNSIDKATDTLLIATIATEYPKEMAAKYTKAFTELGVNKIKILDISKREEAFINENRIKIEEASLIFFTGGDQLRITSLIGGTPIYDALKESASNGNYIVGTSAGASVMCETMILEGEDEEAPRKCTITMSSGLGLVKNMIIDQHFIQRGRIGRLLTAVAQNPEMLGIGIDENTAICLNSKGNIEVIGEGAVYFLDGSNITYSNVSEQKSDEVLSIYNVKIDVLKEGNKFDLKKRLPFKERNA